ncbi:hypothetical protein HanIR_Chr09g0393041 [Helianthus annuus]|nr:hypothetical protein HanIR_Chr09g0393041 [Helianthus annuus]
MVTYLLAVVQLKSKDLGCSKEDKRSFNDNQKGKRIATSLEVSTCDSSCIFILK